MVNEHVCLFYLADKLPPEKLRQFFYRIHSVLSQSDEKFQGYYLFYSIQCGLFNKEPLTDELLAELKKLKTNETCAKTCKRREYKQYQIEQHACPICRFSNSYLNMREKVEATVLGHFFRKNEPFQSLFVDPSQAFLSKERVCSDYQFGTHPVVPFNLYIYRFLETIGGIGEHTVASFYREFLSFFKQQILLDGNETCVQMDDESISERIYLLVEGLYSVSSRADKEHFEKALAELKTPYTYSAPLPALPASKTKKVSSNKAISTQLNLFDVLAVTEDERNADMGVSEPLATVTHSATPSILDSYSPILPSSEKCSNVESSSEATEELVSVAESVSFSGDVEIDDCNIPLSAFSDVDAPETTVFTEPTESQVDSFDEYAIAPTELYTESESSSPINIEHPISVEFSSIPESTPDDSSVVESEPVVEHAGFDNILPVDVEEGRISKEPSVCDIPPLAEHSSNVIERNFYCIYEEQYPDALCPITSPNAFEFTAEVLGSSFLSIEPCLCDQEDGLLIYTQKSQNLYFLNLPLYGLSALESLIYDSTIEVYTTHSVELMYLFSKYDSCFEHIFSLDLIASFVYGHKELSKCLEQLHLPGDCLKHQLNAYPTLFEQLEPSKYLKSMHRTLKTYSLLFRFYDLTKIDERLRPAFTPQNLYEFVFAFPLLQSPEVHLPGTLYCMTLPEKTLAGGFLPNSFSTDVALILASLPHEHLEHLHLLTLSHDKICLFYDGDDVSRTFYDLFLSSVQTAYLKRMKQPLISNSYFIKFQ